MIVGESATKTRNFFFSALGAVVEFSFGLVECEVLMGSLVKITSTKLNIINLS